MRRMFLAVSGLALGVALVTGVGVRAEQAQDPAVIDKAMKSLGPAFGATRKALDSGNMADAKTGAQTISKAMADTEAFLDFLAARPDVKPGRVGTTGYCMGGFMSLSAAGTYPDRIAATASYHGGRLATDAPDSPHLLAPKIRSRVYIAGAIEDATFTDEMKARLEDALTKAGVDHAIETYPAKHGWVLRDTLAYDEAESERHYETLLAFFDETLG